MSQLNILAMVGGISKNSLNKKLYKAFNERKPQDVSLEDFDISQLPYFSQDIENDPPQVVKDLKKKIQESSAVLFVTPEYNHSFPGVLKNAIDWASRPPKQGVWENKKVAVIGASLGAQGTYASQLHLRQVLVALNMKVMQKPEFYMSGGKSFDEQGNLSDKATEPYIEKFWNSFVAFIRD